MKLPKIPNVSKLKAYIAELESLDSCVAVAHCRLSILAFMRENYEKEIVEDFKEITGRATRAATTAADRKLAVEWREQLLAYLRGLAR